jgi:NADH:ubiquinone oxidoreductase subunit 5 (subunit L)/multisubunit Na+/H+ antiporter MnhA subunit
MVGALVLLMVTRLLGIALSGEPRSPESRQAHEAGPAMLAAMALSALLCLAVGIGPGWALKLVAAPLELLSAGSIANGTAILAALPFGPGWSRASLVLALFLIALLAWRYRRRPLDQTGSTWACGFFKPAPRMSYTAGGYGQLAEDEVYCGCLRTRVSGKRPRLLFPALWQWRTRSGDPVLDRAVAPFFARAAALAGTWRRLQGGHLNLYLTYFFAATILLLGWAVFS